MGIKPTLSASKWHHSTIVKCNCQPSWTTCHTMTGVKIQHTDLKYARGLQSSVQPCWRPTLWAAWGAAASCLWLRGCAPWAVAKSWTYPRTSKCACTTTFITRMPPWPSKSHPPSSSTNSSHRHCRPVTLRSTSSVHQWTRWASTKWKSCARRPAGH